MQKSAHISSIATRLNNLEQKVDGLDEPSGGDVSAADVARIVKNTMEHAQTGLPSPSGDWRQNTYFYEQNNVSMSYMIFGWAAPHADIATYTSCLQVPLYDQVFGGFTDYFGPVDSGTGRKGTLAGLTFGSGDMLEFLNSSAPWEASLAGRCFGDANSAASKFTDLGETTLLDVCVELFEEIERLKNRVAALE